MLAIARPINDPETLPRTTLTGINHLQYDFRGKDRETKILYQNFLSTSKDEILKQTEKKKRGYVPLKHFLQTYSLPELGKN